MRNNSFIALLAALLVLIIQTPAYADFYVFQGGGSGGGGSGTVGNGNAGQVAYYNTTGTTVIGDINMNVSAGALTMGQAGSVAGSIILSGSTSGTGVIQVAATAGAGIVFQIPSSNGSSGQFLQTNGAGVTSWQTVSGSGTVTAVTSGNITGFATVTVATNTTTPAFSYALTAAGANQFWGSHAGGAPAYIQPAFTDISGVATTAQLPTTIVYGAQSGSAGTFISSINSSGVATFGTPTGAVASVTNADGTLTISPTTGAVVASIATSAPLPGSPTVASTPALGDSSTKVVNSSFVAAGLAALNPVESVDAATTAVLPNTPTYNNGTAGVGATLTAGSNTTLTVDGFTGSAIGQYFLVKNQATSANNGVYQLTTVGSGAAPWVLTRAVNFNAPTNMNHGSAYFVINGTSNISTMWGMTSSIVTVGSTSMTWAQLAVNPSTVLSNVLPNGQIFIGSVSNVATANAVTGPVLISNAGVTSVANNAITNAMIRQSGALSVVGNSTSSTANVADITASAGGQLFGSNAAGTALAFSATPQLGVAGTTSGTLTIAGSTSGTCTIQTNVTAGTGTVFQLPNSNGSSGQFLQTNGSGVTSWQTVSGSGTVNSGTAGQVSYYATSTNAVSGNANLTISSGAVTVGQAGSVAGSLVLSGLTSGTCTVQVAGTAGSTTFQLPANNGSSGQFLQTNGSGITSWQTVSGTGTVNSGTAGQMTWYAGTGTAVSGNANATISTGALTLGQSGTAGSLILNGATSGTVTVSVPATAGSTTFQLPGTNGSAGQTLQTNGSGVTSWTSTSITQSAGDNTTNIATTAFVNTAITNAIAGVNPAIAVTAATTTVLPNTPTYNNGAAGIGATLTAGSNTTLTVDGVTFSAITQSLLVKNQASAFQNGIYNVTQVGSGILPWILTRRLDYDQPSDINNTGAIPVVSGTVNTSTTWVLTSNVTTVGTDALTYVQFTLNPTTIATISGTPSSGQVAVWSSGSAVGGSANFTASAGALTLGQSGTAGSVILNGATSGTCTLQVAAAAGTSTIFQLPATNGSSGQFLQTNGSGITSWQTVSSGGSFNGVPGGRLTLTTGVPVTTSNVTAATSIFYTPYLNDTSYTYTSSLWAPYTFTQYTASVPASQFFRIYDVFDNGTGLTLTAWDSGGQTTGTITGATAANPCVLTATNTLSAGDYVGVSNITGTLGTDSIKGLNGKVCRVSAASGSTITLEGMDTTSLTYTSGGNFYKIPQSRTGAITILQGHYADASNRLYLGSFMTTGLTGGQTEDSTSRRLVWNYFNRSIGNLVAIDATSNWTYSTSGTTARPADANTTDGIERVSIMVGVSEDVVDATRMCATQVTGSNHDLGIGINSNTTNIANSTYGFNNNASNGQQTVAKATVFPSIGYSFIQNIEATSGTNLLTFGTNASGYIVGGLTVQVRR